jgi:uncharacterized protein
MTRNAKITALIAAGLTLAGAATYAVAQSASLITVALSEGQVGEQADGYLGIRGPSTSALRAEVDAINIKRRAAYTGLAEQRGVTIKDVAAATGCETLAKRVTVGRAYMMPDGVWRVRKAGEIISLPGYCVS